MGSQGPEKDIHVLVTGFGPFRINTINPSYLIASSLPPTIPASSPSTPTIHIHAHPSPLRVSYPTVRSTVPPLLFAASPTAPATSPDGVSPPSSGTPDLPPKQTPNFDVVLFIGMAPGRTYFTLETQAHRDGYVDADVDGRAMKGDKVWREEMEAPEVLKTGVDTGGVLGRWARKCQGMDVRLSDDAGHYLCDFVYYTGLVEYWRRDQEAERQVAFLHVPGGIKERDVEKGRKVTVELVKAVVESRWGLRTDEV